MLQRWAYLATINYTSGTTGKPKGVMLSHRAMMTSAIGVGEFMMCGQKPTTDDVWFSYLPMAHIFERIAHVMLLSYGAKWAYTSGDMTKIIHELSLVKPTIFGAVPRTLNKLVDKIKGFPLNAKSFRKKPFLTKSYRCGF